MKSELKEICIQLKLNTSTHVDVQFALYQTYWNGILIKREISSYLYKVTLYFQVVESDNTSCD